MIGVAQPGQWRPEYGVTQHFRRATHNLAEEQAVGEQRHVAPVLFQRGNGKTTGVSLDRACTAGQFRSVSCIREPVDAVSQPFEPMPRAAVVPR